MLAKFSRFRLEMTPTGSENFRSALAWHRLRTEIAWLNFNDWLWNTSVVGESPVAVSMTTHGSRLRTVHTTIQSISAGKIRPSRFVLWLNGDPNSPKITPQLNRLQRRGLEIRYVENFGPHTKYFPYVKQFTADDVPLVTADDDVIYPTDWLADLLAAHHSAPSVIHCHLARRIALDDGKLLPYANWKYVSSCEPSFRTFALGFAGVIYPKEFLSTLRVAGDCFMTKCPKADDVWLHAMAVRNGYKIRQLTENPGYPRSVPCTQDVALFNTNQLPSGNDAQILATYTTGDLDTIANSA